MGGEQLLLTLSASGLRNVAGLGKGTSDPFAVVTLLAEGAGEAPRVLGRTEVIKNTLSPNWTTSFLIDYELGRETHLNVSVIDEVRKASDKPMGSAVFEIGDVLGSRGNVKAKKFKKGGTLYARLQKAPPVSAGKLGIRLRGIKLKNVEGMFKKSDPFFEICRSHEGVGAGTWTPVYRSRHAQNNLNPAWGAATIDVNALCDGDLDRKLRVRIFDHESNGKHQSMGEFDASVNEILRVGACRPAGSASFTPKRNGKAYGKICVDEAKITGAESQTTAAVRPGTMAATESSVLPMPVPVPVPQFGGGGQPGMAPGSMPTFVDYVSGQCNLNLVVAIDFTGSNGDPRIPGTLHHFSPNGQMNGYEKAITSVGNILARYDSDQMFPVLGFGAKYGGIVRHCFQVGQQPEVHGVQGILDAYKGVFKTALTMSGPTVFTEVIAHAAAKAKSQQQTNPLSYTILLLLTDGAVTDVNATKQALAAVADAPLSVVIVGIGNADFSSMQFLDDFETRSGMNRDIVQFVQFNAHAHDKTSLTRATLEEIPDQLVQFFHRRGIMPKAAVDLRASRIVAEDFNEEADIDLTLNFQEDGEIVLGDTNGAVIDNSYEAGLGGLHVMPPPGTSAPPAGVAASAPVMTAPGTGTAPGYNPYASMPAAGAGATGAAAPVMAASVAAPPTAPQPVTFQVQLPQGVCPGMQIQVPHPQTGQQLVVAVPEGVPPGGVFSVTA